MHSVYSTTDFAVTAAAVALNERILFGARRVHAGARVHGAGADRRLSPPESHDLAGALWRRKGPGRGGEGRGRRQVRVGSEGGGGRAHGESLLYHSPSGWLFVSTWMFMDMFM